MYTALKVASYVIWYCQQRSYIISNLKLQKILYFIQAQFLVFGNENKACFSDDIQAWKFGPVVPDVYRKYRLYGNAHIPSFDKEENFSEIAEKDKAMINRMVDRCADYTASQLTATTERTTPYQEAYAKGTQTVITHESIRKFYEEV